MTKAIIRLSGLLCSAVAGLAVLTSIPPEPAAAAQPVVVKKTVPVPRAAVKSFNTRARTVTAPKFVQNKPNRPLVTKQVHKPVTIQKKIVVAKPARPLITKNLNPQPKLVTKVPPVVAKSGTGPLIVQKGGVPGGAPPGGGPKGVLPPGAKPLVLGPVGKGVVIAGAAAGAAGALALGGGGGKVPPSGQLFTPAAAPKLGLPPGAKIPFKPYQVKFYPAYPGYRWAGRPRFPLWAVVPAVALGAAGAYWWSSETSWSRPYPNCYVGGGVYYADPYSGSCFDFTSAEDGDYFMVNRRVYRWYPTRYETPEDTIYEESRLNEDAPYDDDWVKKAPPRKSRVAASVVPSSAAASLNLTATQRTDCSSCIAAMGPIQGPAGQCTTMVVNNCAHPVTVDGGFHKTDAGFCEFSGDIVGAGEMTVCTKPCAEFEQAQAYIKTAMPQSTWKGPVNGCKSF